MEKIVKYIFSILKTLGIATLGIAIALILNYLTEGGLSDLDYIFGNIFWSRVFVGLLFGGIPFGWSQFKNWLGFIKDLGEHTIVLYFILMFIVSYLTGWAILLYNLAKDIIGLIAAIIDLKKQA